MKKLWCWLRGYHKGLWVPLERPNKPLLSVRRCWCGKSSYLIPAKHFVGAVGVSSKPIPVWR